MIQTGWFLTESWWQSQWQRVINKPQSYPYCIHYNFASTSYQIPMSLCTVLRRDPSTLHLDG